MITTEDLRVNKPNMKKYPSCIEVLSLKTIFCFCQGNEIIHFAMQVNLFYKYFSPNGIVGHFVKYSYSLLPKVR